MHGSSLRAQSVLRKSPACCAADPCNQPTGLSWFSGCREGSDVKGPELRSKYFHRLSKCVWQALRLRVSPASSSYLLHLRRFCHSQGESGHVSLHIGSFTFVDGDVLGLHAVFVYYLNRRCPCFSCNHLPQTEVPAVLAPRPGGEAAGGRGARPQVLAPGPRPEGSSRASAAAAASPALLLLRSPHPSVPLRRPSCRIFIMFNRYIGPKCCVYVYFSDLGGKNKAFLIKLRTTLSLYVVQILYIQ